MTDTIVFTQLAKLLNGTFTEGHYGRSDGVEATHRHYKIVFDYHTEYRTVDNSTIQQTYTRITSQFRTKESLKLNISRKTLLGTIGKFFGAQDIIVGDDAFDDAFIIKGNNESKIKMLLTRSIREQIEGQSKINIGIDNRKEIWGEPLPWNELELYFFTEGKIKDISELENYISCSLHFLTGLSV